MWRITTRASLCCAVLHLLKRGARRAARGKPRAERVVNYVCDVLLPTGFYGPLLGCSMVVLQAVRALLDGGSGAGGGEQGEEEGDGGGARQEAVVAVAAGV